MTRSVRVGDKQIGSGHPCFIIAEAGVNHNGDIGLAKQLVDVAAEAGADAVKFQTFRADRLVGAKAPKAAYQSQMTDPSESQLDMLRRLELLPDAHRELVAYCREQDILLMSTPFDDESVDLLDDLGVPVFKIPSGEITNWPFLAYVARKGKPIILSTGMSYLSEVDEAVRVIRAKGGDELVLLHCVTNYPADPADANLRAMETMASAFRVPVGFSDHTLGIEVALAAVALGASVIEKHFTLDRSLPGPDHQASLAPNELRAMVHGIRTIEQSLGDGVKQPVLREHGNRQIARRSLHLRVSVEAGTLVGPDVLVALRPAGGIPPSELECVVGRSLKRDLVAGTRLRWDDLA